MKALMPLLVLFAPVYGGFSAQTVWDGGPGVPGPVTNWSDTFESHLRCNYEDMPGELFLNLQAVNHHVTSYPEYSVPGAVADMNGDGHLDILGGSQGYSNNSVSWFENDGAGGGWERHEVSNWGELTAPWSFSAADVDGDGDMDVLGAEELNSRIYLWINTDGAGHNWETCIIADNLLYSPRFVTTSDIDGDSDPDVVARTGGGPTGLIHWFENPMPVRSPTDEWTEHLVGVKTHCNQISLGDINGDGWMDVISAAEGNNKQLSWWVNPDGTGDNWVEHAISGLFRYARAANSVDMDGDGDLDVIAAGSDMLSWFENKDGEGLSWTRHPISDPFVLCNHIIGVDAFGTGQPVILFCYNSHLILRERTDDAGLNWRMHMLETGNPYYTGILVGDIDGDDTLDAVSYADYGSNIAWYRLGYPETGWLTSSILNVNNYPHWDEVQWEDSVPSGSFLGFRVRSSNDPADMGEWSGYIEEPGSLEGFVDSTHRYIQYRVVMESGGRFITPSLDVVIFLWDWLGVEGLEDATRLHPVTPNPCCSPVEIRFSLAEPGPVTIRVFDLCGRVVASPVDGEVSGGEHSVQLASLPPGAYFVRMTAGENVLRERFVLLGER